MPIINMVYKKKKGWKPGANTIAYYPLTSTTTVYDQSGNGYDLENNGGVTFDSIGATFNGNYLGRGSTTGLPTGANVRTVSFWCIQTDRGQGQQTPFRYGNSSNGGDFWINFNAGGDLGFTGNGSSYNSPQTYNTTPGNWYNIIAVYTSDTLYVYVNNTLGITYAKTLLTGNNFLYIGSDNVFNLNFKGKISDVIIENKAWDSDERATYYAGSKSRYGKNGWKPGANTIAYYPLKGDLNDYSGNGYNAESTGGTITYPNNEYANFSTAYARFSNGYSSGTTTDDITISLWARDITPSGGEGNMFVMGQDGFGSGWGAMIRTENSNNDYLAYTVTGGAAQLTSSYNVSSGVRHHFVETVSPTSGEMKFYIDGVLKETVSINSSMRIDGKSAIGKVGNYAHNVNGDFSEIINERKARTAQEIADYYDQTKANYGIS